MKVRDRTPTHDLENLSPQVRQRIEDAALQLFSRREFHRVGLDEIAREANASLQTIYKYYGSKDAIQRACLNFWLSKLATRMVDHLKGIETYKDRLRKVFWVVLDFFDRNPKVAEMIHGSVYGRTWRKDESFQQKELTQTFLHVLNEGVEKGILTDEVEPAILLDYVYGVLMRLIQMHIVRREETALADRAEILFEMIWRAIAKPAAA